MIKTYMLLHTRTPRQYCHLLGRDVIFAMIPDGGYGLYLLLLTNRFAPALHLLFSSSAL